MPKNEYIYLKGKVKWFKHTSPNKFGKWAHDLYMEGESLDKFRKLQEEGVLTKLRKDEDGYNATISRPVSKTIRGREQGFAPPEVLAPDGVTPIRDMLVGNGSDVTTKVVVYSYRIPGMDPPKYGKAIRWESTRIDNLVAFDPHKDFDKDQEKMISGLAEQPPQQLF